MKFITFVLVFFICMESANAQVEAISYMRQNSEKKAKAITSVKELKKYDDYAFYQTFIDYEGYKVLDKKILISATFIKRVKEIRKQGFQQLSGNSNAPVFYDIILSARRAKRGCKFYLDKPVPRNEEILFIEEW